MEVINPVSSRARGVAEKHLAARRGIRGAGLSIAALGIIRGRNNDMVQGQEVCKSYIIANNACLQNFKTCRYSHQRTS